MDDERLKIWAAVDISRTVGTYPRHPCFRKVFYRQVLEIYATSIDYDPKAEISVQFFKKFRIKFIMPSTVRLPLRSFTTVQMPKRNLWV